MHTLGVESIPPYVLYFMKQAVEGNADGESCRAVWFEINPTDWRLYEELRAVEKVYLVFREKGIK